MLALGLAGCGGAASTTASIGSVPASSSPPSLVAKASAAPPSPSSAGNPAALTKVNLLYATDAGPAAPVWVAGDEGLYKKYGLEVALSHAGGSLSTDALVAGKADMALNAGADSITAMTAGTSLKIVLVLQKVNPYAVVVQPSIKAASDLKGKSLAISKIGDTSDLSAHIALGRFGLVPGKDVVERQIGNSPARFAALQSGQVDAAMEDEAYTDLLVQQGMHVLVSLSQEKVPYIANALIVAGNFTKKDPRTVEAVIRGTLDGLHFVTDSGHRNETLSVIAKYQRTDAASPKVAKVYETLQKTLAQDPTPDLAGAETMLTSLKVMDPTRYAKLSPAEVIDASFIKAVKASPAG